jgi:hypothetical protein
MNAVTVSAARNRALQLSTHLEELLVSEEDTLRKLDTVRASIEDTRRLVKVYTNLAAPIALLPDELLAGIFKMVSDPLKVASVSKHWRSVALAYPFLWSNIDFSWPAVLISLFLARSQNASLRVIFWGNFDFEGLQKYIQVSLHRWESLTVMTDDIDVALQCLVEFSDIDAPQLHELNLTMPSCSTSGDWFKLFSFGAPNLSCVAFKGLPIDNCHFPYNNVTCLQLDALDDEYSPTSFTQFAGILSAMPSLRHLALQKEAIDFSTEDSMHSVIVHTLESLELGMITEENYLANFCLALTTPALSCLKLSFGYRDQQDHLISSLRSHSQTMSTRYPNLHKLVLESTDISLDFLRSIPDVWSLVLDDTDAGIPLSDDSRIMEFLSDELSVWPNLQHLYIGEIDTDAEENLLGLVEARYMAGSPIRTLVLRSSRGCLPNEDVQHKLEKRVHLQMYNVEENPHHVVFA